MNQDPQPPSHLTDEDLVGYLLALEVARDGERPVADESPQGYADICRHLNACPSCEDRLIALMANYALIHSAVRAEHPSSELAHASPGAAQPRLPAAFDVPERVVSGGRAWNSQLTMEAPQHTSRLGLAHRRRVPFHRARSMRFVITPMVGLLLTLALAIAGTGLEPRRLAQSMPLGVPEATANVALTMQAPSGYEAPRDPPGHTADLEPSLGPTTQALPDSNAPFERAGAPDMQIAGSVPPDICAEDQTLLAEEIDVPTDPPVASITFAPGSDAVSAQSERVLAVVAKAARASSRDVRIVGFASPAMPKRATQRSNKQLSVDRAKACEALIVAQGLPRARIRAIGRGVRADLSEAECRRAEVFLVPRRTGR